MIQVGSSKAPNTGASSAVLSELGFSANLSALGGSAVRTTLFRVVKSTFSTKRSVRPAIKRTLQVGLPLAALLFAGARFAASAAAGDFRFVILGDRTGEVQPGVYEEVWREIAAERPAFVVSVGDTIQGMHDTTAESEWRAVETLLKPYRKMPLYLAAGNHDIWSEASESLFRKHTGRPPRFSFDYGPAHFTVLDNSRADELAGEDLSFVEADLKEHAAQPLKFVVSHRPSWIIQVALQNTNYPLHQLAKKYGVRYVIAGHIHQMMRFELEGVTYLSMVSSGGHLRASGAYKDGWFFGHGLVEVHGADIQLRIEEAKAPYGEGRVTKAADWGMLGLSAQRAAGGSLSAGIPAR